MNAYHCCCLVSGMCELLIYPTKLNTDEILQFPKNGDILISLLAEDTGMAGDSESLWRHKAEISSEIGALTKAFSAGFFYKRTCIGLKRNRI